MMHQIYHILILNMRKVGIGPQNFKKEKKSQVTTAQWLGTERGKEKLINQIWENGKKA